MEKIMALTVAEGQWEKRHEQLSCLLPETSEYQAVA